MHFVITIDTECDDAWGWTYSRRLTTENAKYLPRFQELCERYGFKPTYLTTYEMAVDSTFQSFGRKVLERGNGEIGLHVHAWNSPPLTNRPEWDRFQAYGTEIPVEYLAPKMNFLTEVLKDTFGITPLSHRGGRYGFDGRIASLLIELGYQVDCSVTPGESWRNCAGSPGGNGGPDYRDFPLGPYFIDPANIASPGLSSLLEVPVTIRPNYSQILDTWARQADERSLMRRAVQKVAGPPHSWLRPRGYSSDNLQAVVDWARSRQLPVIEFILHSSELMPGGSPNFRTAGDIEALYSELQALFEYVNDCGIIGATLAEYRAAYDPTGNSG